ncbi:MAG: Asp-tRNA(Asn)/Glu-tRNA(Gln) amidotransferase subunit GatC [Bacteroidetes bacterium]|nr:Asp-tRNA(Asn)/Glu-tRNA(Gln) amidotransferase subunit GatC [Bacteroidota bacterium]
MEITTEMIDRLAHLARLQFNKDEKNTLKTDLEKMIGFVEKLKEVDTTGVEPLLHITDAVNVWRDDEVKQTIAKEEALLNAPLSDGNFFKVPKVIKKENEENKSIT